VNGTPERSFDRRAEVERLLEQDETVLGRFWRYERDGLSAEEMQEAEGTETAGWTYNYRSVLGVIRDGEVPTAPSRALQGARRIRSWLKLPDLSPELRQAFIEQESLLMSRAEDRDAQQEEVGEAVKKTMAAEEAAGPGIYVYTLPHYLRYPYEPDSGRTLLKIGHSARDAVYRATSQGKLTALPEDPILLRVYPVGESAKAEARFHEWLRDADHAGNRTLRGGSEWFVTSTKFLDRVARSVGLDVLVVNEFETGDV
jgi:hypothetical protein